MYNLIRMIDEHKGLYHNGNAYVVASFSSRMQTPEVLVFPANSQGEITSWTEMYGQKYHEPLLGTVQATIQMTVNNFNKSGGGYNDE